MHKGVILLIKIDDVDDPDCASEARESADYFMTKYQDTVWDWYQIGGRWTGALSKYDPTKDPDNFETCSSCNGKGCHRCENGYKLKWPTNWKNHPGDILPLESCIDVVKEWGESTDSEDEYLRRAAEHADTGHNLLRAYYLHSAASIIGQQFSFDANVFNTESYNFSIPDDLDGWFAVMIDMHN